MFEKIYNDSISKVEPDVELIGATKKMMQNELNNKKFIKNISFYKYASVAACLIVVVSIFSVRHIEQSTTTMFSSDIDSIYSSGVESDSIYSDIKSSNSNSFFAAESSNALGVADDAIEVNENGFVKCFKEVIQWFYKLLF